MRLRITHDTCYRYLPAVQNALHLAYLRPPHTRRQRRLEARLEIRPEPALLSQALDIYGNPRSFFEIPGAHDELRIRATSLVHTQAPDPADSTIAWERVQAGFVYHAGTDWHPAAEFVYPSIHVHPGNAFADYARPSFTPGRPLIDAARELMQRVHQDFHYASASTDITTPAASVLAQRRGVCQDFAHVMLACLRSLGLPARYVSGYLLTEPPPGQLRLVGGDASHAWVSVFLPDLAERAAGHGWYDLDPTNARDGWSTPGEDFVRLAVGRDYADISPVRGVVHGGGRHQLQVGVTVEPFDAPTLADAPACPMP